MWAGEDFSPNCHGIKKKFSLDNLLGDHVFFLSAAIILTSTTVTRINKIP